MQVREAIVLWKTDVLDFGVFIAVFLTVRDLVLRIFTRQSNLSMCLIVGAVCWSRLWPHDRCRAVSFLQLPPLPACDVWRSLAALADCE